MQSADKFMQEFKQGSEEHRGLDLLYIKGIAEGMNWVNGYMLRDFHTRYYCPPQKIPFTPEQYIDMIERHLKQKPRLGEKPIGLVLLETLKATIPCEK
jgi:hypothetical protein